MERDRVLEWESVGDTRPQVGFHGSTRLPAAGSDVFGILNINKPAGITSRDAVNQIQRLVRPAKCGHAGTLDPLASGVLVVGVGPATRLIPYIQQMSKAYRATFLLGRRSDTEDIEGTVDLLPDPPIPSRQQVEACLPDFTGNIQQRPPAYSALKVQGQRAYVLARQGQNVELSPRSVSIESIHVVAYDYPTIDVEVVCGSGTYIRSLGRDIAERLGTASVMSALTRTAIGHFGLTDATSVDTLTLESLARELLPPQLALSGLPQVVLTAAEQMEIAHGRSVADRFQQLPATREMAALNEAGQLVALLVPDSHGGWRSAKNFSHQL